MIISIMKILQEEIDGKNKVQAREADCKPARQSIVFSTQKHWHNKANKRSK